ncbi:hypothetical protein T484DRAFT_1860917 [Baffinella frigidus]|nr:hypothetical protein T484DRAFT_1860917 [Cryptophyta sp. CCMP2293]
MIATTNTIASVMYEFAVTQEYTTTELRDELVKIVNSIKEQATGKKDSDAFVRETLAKAANEKMGGKSALFMLLGVEAALSVSTQEAPEATFTYCAKEQFEGIWVLYNVLGNSVDTSDSIRDNCGLNVAGACRLSYQMYGAQILEFICALWPKTSTQAVGDRDLMQRAIDDMERQKHMRSITNLMNQIPGSNKMSITTDSVLEFMADDTDIADQILDLITIGRTRPMTKDKQLKFDQATELVLPDLEDYMFMAYDIKNARDAA